MAPATSCTGVSGATVIGNASTATLNFNGTTYNASQQTYTAAAGQNVVLNAGAAIYCAGGADSLKAGVAKADEMLSSGEARNRLDRLVVLSQSFDS